MITPEQRATRRRALGRKLILKASSLAIDISNIQDSPDLEFLTPKETAMLTKLLKGLQTVHDNFHKMGGILEKSE